MLQPTPHSRIPQRFRRAGIGALLSLGAPMGWLIIEAATGLGKQADQGYQLWLYLYITFGTMVAFALFGYVLGRAEQIQADLAQVDHLTALANPRSFQERLDAGYAQSRRSHRPLCLLLVDLDHFKRVNDIHGHQAGDEVLRTVARAISSSVRTGDFVARVGGEELAAILPDTDSEGGRVLAERVREAVATAQVRISNHETLNVRCSVGVAGTDLVRASTPRELFAAVDAALYAAKRGGRDRVAVAAPVV